MENYQYRKAERADLPEILVLQYLACQSETGMLNNFSVPSLKQTLQAIELEYRNSLILKAIDEKGRIVGSVRGYAESGSLYIGKLIVHPKLRERGIGTRLLSELERLCPQSRYELFTSSKGDADLRLYERLGYSRFKEKPLTRSLNLVFLEKLKSLEPVHLS